MVIHFLKHMNRSVDFLGERATSEISTTELIKIGKELEKLSEKLKKQAEFKLEDTAQTQPDDQLKSN